MLRSLSVLVIGGGMITHDQILPSLYHLQRLNIVGDIYVCSRRGSTLRRLAESPQLTHAFPGQSFHALPELIEQSDECHPELYIEAIKALPPLSLVVVAVPDQLHHEVCMQALQYDHHVLCVKPMATTYAHAVEIEELADRKGLFVGIDYHKRFDRRALIAKRDYSQGYFGHFRMGEARMIEPWCYRNSNFKNWFLTKNYDPFTYVGCHYIDQLFFITGLRPVSVSVIGIEGEFPNKNNGIMWSSGRVIFENHGILNIINGLGYPDDAPGSNDQGLTLYCDDGKDFAGLIRHNDQFRGVKHVHVENSRSDGKLSNFINPDYFQYVPWFKSGLKPVGYGYESIESIVGVVRSINGVTDLLERRTRIHEIDKQGIIATPANSSINELVIEAARISISNHGVNVSIVYNDFPHVECESCPIEQRSKY